MCEIKGCLFFLWSIMHNLFPNTFGKSYIFFVKKNLLSLVCQVTRVSICTHSYIQHEQRIIYKLNHALGQVR